MAIQALQFISLILRPLVQQSIDEKGWRYLLLNADPNRNFDGEIMAFGAMSGGDMDHIINRLVTYGYIGPDNGDESDMVVSYSMFGTSYVPSWLELVDVVFFDKSLTAVKAWKQKESNEYKLLNFETNESLPMKGYECDWPPHIGKISSVGGRPQRTLKIPPDLSQD